jgi:membrane-bound lytic murein transglycosylase D
MVTRRISAVFTAAGILPALTVILLIEGAVFPGALPAQEKYYNYNPDLPASSASASVPPEVPAPAEKAAPPRPGPVFADGRPLRGNADTLPAAPFVKPAGGPYAGADAGTLRIPGFEQALTRQYIERYSSGSGREWLMDAAKRAGPYLHFIRKQIAERDLPPELLYLPVIESGFLATARSRSGAVGLWQFMRNSIAPFDIRVNDWIDERMDFWKSTEGALRKLEENYRALGDWPLALAAYNAGLGGIQRAARQAGKSDYWHLAEKKLIKLETVHYVPKLLAASYILSNPRRFALDLDWSEDPCWERVAVGKQVDLELLAAEAGVDGGALKAANRELVYGITPPDKDYRLKVRAADAPLVKEALERANAVLIKYYFHTIHSGDTLSALALRYGVSVDQIAGANPGVNAKYLKIGARLRIPAYRDAEPYQDDNTAVTDGAPEFTGTHLVKKGETLWSIALAYGVNLEALAAANGLVPNDTLKEGKILKMPGAEGPHESF